MSSASLPLGTPEPSSRSFGQKLLLGLAAASPQLAIVGVWLAIRPFVRHDALGVMTHLVFVAVLATLMLGLTVFLFRSSRPRRERLARSIASEGLVVDVEISGIKGDSGYREVPTIRYRTGTGDVIEHEPAVPVTKLREGDVVAVRYDPQEPDWVVVDGRDPLGLRAGLAWFIGFSVLGFALVANYAVRLPDQILR